jgi:hypothetical protein
MNGKQVEIAIEQNIQMLNTKQGADAFVAERLQKVTELLANKEKFSDSMRMQLEHMKNMLEKDPTGFVTRETNKRQRALTTMRVK